MHADEDFDDEASRQAHKSNITKQSGLATVSPPIALMETSRSVEAFSMAYDRLYREFQERLVGEYGNTRHIYIGEYQVNFD